jgi:hypothetical protein
MSVHPEGPLEIEIARQAGRDLAAEAPDTGKARSVRARRRLPSPGSATYTDAFAICSNISRNNSATPARWLNMAGALLVLLIVSLGALEANF